MPQLDSYIFFNGNCAEAMRFYHQTLGGTLQPMLKYGDSPDPAQCPASDRDRVMHTTLALDDGRLLMASDTPAAHGEQASGRFALSLFYASPEEARRVFAALAQGGSVTMQVAETFWAQAFGMCTDRFGIPWMVGGGRKEHPPGRE